MRKDQSVLPTHYTFLSRYQLIFMHQTYRILKNRGVKSGLNVGIRRCLLLEFTLPILTCLVSTSFIVTSGALTLRDLKFCRLLGELLGVRFKIAETFSQINIFCFFSMVTIYCIGDFTNRLPKFDGKTTHFQLPVITTF